jgi:4-hydroxybenzoate polyprenyltransferase/phosphoserine phosphatase
MDERTKAASDIPLVVDLDGTLIKIDSLHEALVHLVSRMPLQALRVLIMLKHGRAAFKAAIADHVLPDVDTLPIDEAVLEAIKQARKEGRKIYLATAADRRFANAIVDSLGGFDGVFASADGVNLKGKVKADRLVAAFGVHGFDYIGNDAADLPIWQVARTALVSGAPSRLMQRLRRELPTAIVLGTRNLAIGPYLLALRPHQWLKNGLIALPAVAAHDFSISGLVTVLIAFASFSLGASSIYLVNDILDLPHDRAHPEKRHRSIAAGKVPLSHAVFLFGVVAALSIALALMLPLAFMLILIAYFGLSTIYSLHLKRKLMVDVVALAALYGARVLAGGAATGIVLSHWLVGFCFFIFLSLALVKRMAEIVALAPTSVGNVKGRGYRNEDRQTIVALSAASGFVAVLVLALYINSPEVTALYRNPDLLWGICIILVYWLGRVYFLTGRGEMHQDPVIFAATDRISLLAGVLVVAVLLVAL